jgi:hypothetical protein
MVELNRKVAAATAIAATFILAGLINVAIWVRDVIVPRSRRRLAHAAVLGRDQSRAGLDSLRDSAAHLSFAAHAWYAAAGAPAVNQLAIKANKAVQAAAAAGQRGAASARLKSGEVVDIQALLTAQSIGWYGPLSIVPTTNPEPGEEDGAESQRSDRLAS